MIVQITATKYYHGSSNNVVYLGNLLPDGYVYFNDDTFYRCRVSGTVSQGVTVSGTDLQLCYMSKEQWVRCGILTNIQITEFIGSNSASVQSVIALAQSELGNTGAKYWNWYRNNVDYSIGPFVDNTTTPWCAAFISYLLGTCHVSSVYFPALSAFNLSEIPAASRITAANLRAGDIVSFNFNGGTTGDHVGLVIGNGGSNALHTIEGNAGGRVTEYFNRSYSIVVCGVRPYYT